MSTEQPVSEPDSGTSGAAPIGSTAAIIIAVLAVVGGFLILRSLSDDGGSAATETTAVSTTAVATTMASTTTTIPMVKEGATVIVANSSGVNGAAGQLTTALEGEGFTMSKATNGTTKTDTTTVHYNPANPNALAVATTLAATLGGAAVSEIPDPAPVDGGALEAGIDVLVLLGTDLAGKPLPTAGGSTATATTAPAVDSATTTTAG